MDVVNGALAEKARALTNAAEEHKRAIRTHRKQLGECMQKLAELQQWCESHGIKLVLVKKGEGETHGQQRQFDSQSYQHQQTTATSH